MTQHIYNIQIRETSNDPLRQSQLVMLEILHVIDAICEKHGIGYWLDAGTLLGAVRHKGFIPWDDDLDICMLRKDYERFLHIASHELPEDLFLQTKATDPTIKWKWAKIRDNFSTFIQLSEKDSRIKYHQGIFIDIFPYDLVKKDIKKYKLLLNRKFQASHNPLYKNISLLLNSMAILPVKAIGYNRLKKILLNRAQKGDLKFVTTGIDISLGYHTFSLDTIFPLKKIEFENYHFFAPANTDRYLTQMFGDYMKIPPVEKRKIHAFKILPFSMCSHKKAKIYPSN